MLILALSLSLYSCEVTKVRQMLVSETVLESKENGFFIDEYLYEYVPISETDTLSVESVFSEYVHYYNANDNYTITESSQLIVKMRKCNPNVLCVNATKKYGDRFLVCTSDSIGFKSKNLLFVKLKFNKDTLCGLRVRPYQDNQKIFNDEIPIGILTIKSKKL